MDVFDEHAHVLLVMRIENKEDAETCVSFKKKRVLKGQ